MASSYSTSLLAPSFPMKIVPYVPQAPKPKLKSKAKSMATTKMAEYSRSGVGSSKDDGKWFRIDDFPMPDLNVSRSLGPAVPVPFGAADASSSLDYDVVSSLGAVPESEKPEHYQSGRESLDGGGKDHAISVVKTNSALNGLFDGSDLEFPLILGSDTAEEHHGITEVEPSNGASDYQKNSYHATASTEGYCAGQGGDLDAASMRALSVEGVEGIRHEPLPAEDEPLFDIDVTSRLLLTRKRTRRSSSDTIISSAEVTDITSEPELEDSRLAKRRRLSERQAEGLILDHMPTPKPTPLPTPSSPDSRFRASNEPSPGPLDNDSQGGGAGSPVPLPNNLDEENGDGGAHVRGTVEEPPHSSRHSVSPFEGAEGEKNGKGSNDESRDSHEDEFGQVNKVSGKPSAKTSQRSKRSDRPVQKSGHSLPQTTLRRRGWSIIPTRTSQNVTSSQHYQLSKPRTDSATGSCSPRTSSPETKAGGGTDKNHGSSANMAYQITDLTHCHVPEGSSIVTAIMRCSESNLPLNPIALYHKLLGGEGRVVRMIQLSSDSWMLLGYRYDDSASSAYNCEGPTLLNADWTSSPIGDAASDDTDHIDDNGDEEYENGEEGNMHSRRRTRVPWLESDDLRLLAYRGNMKMGWEDIFECFPDRTPGAVRMRLHTLQRRRSRTS